MAYDPADLRQHRHSGLSFRGREKGERGGKTGKREKKRWKGAQTVNNNSHTTYLPTLSECVRMFRRKRKRDCFEGGGEKLKKKVICRLFLISFQASVGGEGEGGKLESEIHWGSGEKAPDIHGIDCLRL